MINQKTFLAKDIDGFINIIFNKNRKFILFGIDLGAKKIAVSLYRKGREGILDILNQKLSAAILVSSLNTMANRENHKNISRLCKLIIENLTSDTFCGIVFGVPLNMNGDNGKSAKKVYKFTKKIISEFSKNNQIDNNSLAYYHMDERMTTSYAHTILDHITNKGRSRKSKQKTDDLIASSIILEDFLRLVKNHIILRNITI